MLKPDARGISIRHRDKRSGIALVPIYHKPLFGDSVYRQVIHTDSYGQAVKTVHLWVSDTGTATISQGVYNDIKRAGHFEPLPGNLTPLVSVVADVVNPPGIRLDRNRFEVDQENAKITYWKEPVIV
jgi:hypothetical protein